LYLSIAAIASALGAEAAGDATEGLGALPGWMRWRMSGRSFVARSCSTSFAAIPAIIFSLTATSSAPTATPCWNACEFSSTLPMRTLRLLSPVSVRPIEPSPKVNAVALLRARRRAAADEGAATPEAEEGALSAGPGAAVGVAAAVGVEAAGVVGVEAGAAEGVEAGAAAGVAVGAAAGLLASGAFAAAGATGLVASGAFAAAAAFRASASALTFAACASASVS
jgi:hypothetical protein